MKTSLKHYEGYYTFIKTELKSDYAQTKIENSVIWIEKNLKHICHCYFKGVTTFGFLGDNIFEAANNGLKEGGADVSTNMKIDNSGLTKYRLANIKHKIKTSE